MVMVPYYFKTMTMVMRKSPKVSNKGSHSRRKRTESGTCNWGARIRSISPMHQVVFYGGVSIPTGSTDVSDNTPSKQNAKLGYTMQLGSGTTDLNPALTYMGKWERVFWGAQVSGVLRFYDNRNHYHWGNRYPAHGLAWLSAVHHHVLLLYTLYTPGLAVLGQYSRGGPRAESPIHAGS